MIASGAGKLPSGRMLGKITAGGKFTIYASSAGDGTEVCAGILLEAVDATSTDVPAVLVARDAEVIASKVAAANGAHTAAGRATLESSGIIFR